MEGEEKRRAGGDISGALPPNPRPWLAALADSPDLSAPFGRRPSASAYGITNSESVMWSLISCGSSDQVAVGVATN